MDDRGKRPRALPALEAARVGFTTALWRASGGAAAVLSAISADLAPHDATAAKEAAIAGPLGLLVGLFVNSVFPARIVNRVSLGVWVAPAVLGGVLATVAPDLPCLAAGLFLLGLGGPMGVLVNAAVRRREANRRDVDRELRASMVNDELDRWMLPSFTVIAVLMAAMATFASWRWAIGLVTVLVAATGALAIVHPPENERRRYRPTARKTSAWRLRRRVWRLRLLGCRQILRSATARRHLYVNAAVTGAFAAYWWPLTLLIRDLGWQRWAPLAFAGLAFVRFPALGVVGAFYAMAKKTGPAAAARRAFACSLVAPAVLLVAVLPVWAVPVAVGLTACGLFVSEGTLGGGLGAWKVLMDLGPNQKHIASAAALAAQVGIFVAIAAIAPLAGAGSFFVGAVLSSFAWLVSRRAS